MVYGENRELLIVSKRSSQLAPKDQRMPGQCGQHCGGTPGRNACEGDFPFLFEYKVEQDMDFVFKKERTELDNKIEIRCRRANCNELFMNYFPEGGNNGLCLAGIELKCEKCKRVLRLKNYTEEVLMEHTTDGVFHV